MTESFSAILKHKAIHAELDSLFYGLNLVAESLAKQTKTLAMSLQWSYSKIGFIHVLLPSMNPLINNDLLSYAVKCEKIQVEIIKCLASSYDNIVIRQTGAYT